MRWDVDMKNSKSAAQSQRQNIQSRCWNSQVLLSDYLSIQISCCFCHDPGWSTHLRAGHSGGMGFPPSQQSLSLILMHQIPGNIQIHKSAGSCNKERINLIGFMQEMYKNLKNIWFQVPRKSNLKELVTFTNYSTDNLPLFTDLRTTMS